MAESLTGRHSPMRWPGGRRLRRRLLPWGLAVGLALAGCGGSGRRTAGDLDDDPPSRRAGPGPTSRTRRGHHRPMAYRPGTKPLDASMIPAAQQRPRSPEPIGSVRQRRVSRDETLSCSCRPAGPDPAVPRDPAQRTPGSGGKRKAGGSDHMPVGERRSFLCFRIRDGVRDVRQSVRRAAAAVARRRGRRLSTLCGDPARRPCPPRAHAHRPVQVIEYPGQRRRRDPPRAPAPEQSPPDGPRWQRADAEDAQKDASLTRRNRSPVSGKRGIVPFLWSGLSGSSTSVRRNRCCGRVVSTVSGRFGPLAVPSLCVLTGPVVADFYGAGGAPVGRSGCGCSGC